MFNRLTTTAGIAASALSVAAFAPAHAAPTFDFETPSILNAVTPPNTPFSQTSQGLTATFSGPASEPDGFAISFNSASGPFPAPYSNLVNAFLGTAPTALNQSDALTIAFSSPVTALTLNFGLGSSTGALSLVSSAGGSTSVGGAKPARFAYAEGTLAFTGPAFTSVTLRTSANGFAIDNLIATPAVVAAVPEPVSLLLLGTGLAGAGLLRRRSI